MATSRFLQLQTAAAYTYGTAPPSSSPDRRPSAQSTSSVSSTASSSSTTSALSTPPNVESSNNYSSSVSSSYPSSSYSSASHPSSYSLGASPNYATDNHRPHVEVMRCVRCATSAETISTRGDLLRRVSTDDASASGMVKFGTNLFYCQSCARRVGYT